MDSYGQIMLGVVLFVLAAGVTGYWFLSKDGPKGATLGVGIVLYLLSCYINDEGSRTMHGVAGVVRLLGVIGIIFGVIDLVRGPRTGKTDDNPPPREP